MSDLLTTFKLTIGDLTPNTENDGYYQNFINQAKAQLLSNDIDEETLTGTELGQSAVVAYAEALMNKRDVATDPTLTLLRNTLSAQTKGKRYADES
ncbi:MAG: hypothetical protein IJX91_04590 [Clostridia bacterium]|nr:hypothetical protein [Clostridia bacterium]